MLGEAGVTPRTCSGFHSSLSLGEQNRLPEESKTYPPDESPFQQLKNWQGSLG